MISFYKSNEKDYGYNLTGGGDGSIGRKHTKEWKKFMSKRMTGENNSFYGKRHTEENKKRWSDIKKGKGGRKVRQIDIDTGEIIQEFDNIKLASETTGIDRGNINKCCQEKLKRAGNFKWEYVVE